MVISHRHRLVFLHCRKAAGSSITNAITPWLGPDDIQVGNWSDAVRSGNHLNKKAVQTLAMSPAAWRAMVRAWWKSKGVQGQRGCWPDAIDSAVTRVYRRRLGGRAAHATAADIRSHYPFCFDNYFKFCVVRNPWDHAVSDYFWRLNYRDTNVGFKEFLRRKLDPERPDPERLVVRPGTNWSIYTIGDEVAVDSVLRYETLQEDLKRVGRRFGIELRLDQVPQSKSGLRKRAAGADLYDDECIELVSTIYRREIERFAYSNPYK